MIPVSYKRSTDPGYDIIPADGHAGDRSRRALLNDVAIHHQISVYRAVELFTMLKLHSHWNQRTSVTLRQIFDRLQKDFDRPLEFKMSTARGIVAMYGQNSGEDIWTLVQRFRRDLSMAQEDFISFCVGMTDESVTLASLNMGLLWWDCIRHKNSYSTLRQLFLSSWQKYVSHMNHPSTPRFPVDAPLREYSELSDMTAHLWGKKRAYWVGHYKQRRDDWARFIRQNPNAIAEILLVKKSQLIRYQWLVRWLQEYTPLIQDKVDVWPEIKNEKANKLLEKTMTRYTRKRRDDSLKAFPNEPYKSYARRLDDQLHPKLPFLTLLNTVHTTAKQITGDIAYMYRKLLDASQLEEHEETMEDVWRKEIERHYYEEERWAAWAKNTLEEDLANWAEYDEEDDILTVLQDEEIRRNARERATILIETPSRVQATAPTQYVEEEEEEQLQELEEEDPHEFSDMEDMFDNLDESKEEPTKLTFNLAEPQDTSFLRFKSPLTEMYEKWNRVPDVTAWSRAADCTLLELRKVHKDDFQRIFDIGEKVLMEEAARPEQDIATYDVL